MKHSKPFTALVALNILISICGCKPAEQAPVIAAPRSETASGELKLQALNIGQAVNADQSVSPRTMFAPEDKIVASVDTRGTASDMPVSVKFIAMSDGQVLSEASKKVTATGPAVTNFELSKNAPLAMGRYLIEASIAGKFQARQEISVQKEVPPQAEEK